MRGHTDSLRVLGWAEAVPSWRVNMAGESAGDGAASMEDLQQADDRGLIAAFLDGRHEAFDVIVERHRRNVYQLCYRFVGNHEDASDLAQDVFVRAFKGLKRFKGDSSLGTWLYRVAVNVCLNRVAVKRPAQEAIEADQHIDTRSADPLDAV